MELRYTKDFIELKEKKLSELDKFVKDFIPILRNYVDYVIVSGYIAILFGRNRASEDVDIIIEKPDYYKFEKLWDDINTQYECINAFNPQEAYYEFLKNNTPIRFSKKNCFIPNFEMKLPKIELDNWTLKERKKVVVNNYELFIAPIELEIPYKLFLGSDKDIEDARFLYVLFKKYLDMTILNEFNQKLKTDKLFKRYIE
jgi:hypothetical protein